MNNATWKRVWRGGGREECEELAFSDEFFAPAELEKSEGGEMSILLRVRPQARWWKDWMIKITQAMCDAFPEISHSRFESS